MELFNSSTEAIVIKIPKSDKGKKNFTSISLMNLTTQICNCANRLNPTKDNLS